jgi:hypothetical protein
MLFKRPERTKHDVMIILQNIENYTLPSPTRHHIVNYCRYVDVIIRSIIYNSNSTNSENLLHEFNNISPSLNFTYEPETNNFSYFLDLTITKTDNKLAFDIY